MKLRLILLRLQRKYYFVLVVLTLLLFCGTATAETSYDMADKGLRIVAFGDSLTAGLGVSRDEAYPAQLERRLEELGLHGPVINAGVSGDTTAGGLRRVPWVLSSKPKIVILELGANDGLRGLSLEQTKDNLSRIIEQLQQARVTVILAGMKLPPNYGQDYNKAFEAIYPILAKQYRLYLIPFFLEGVAASSDLNQADGIHPTKEGYRIVAQQVLNVLKPLLHEHSLKMPDAQKRREQ